MPRLYHRRPPNILRDATDRQIFPRWRSDLRILLVIVFILAASQQAAAQNQGKEIDGLELRLWPDFDRPAVLATLIGEVGASPPGLSLITLPLPDGAEVHVVAPLRADGTPGPEVSFDDSAPGEVTFNVESPGFWIEFYYPYTSDGSQRDIRYTWQSDIPVASLSAVVQQPLMSSDLTTDPEAERVTTGNDGMRYHQIAGQRVAAGELYTLDVNYTLVRDQLSVDALSEPGGIGDGDEGDPGANWLLILAVAGGAVALVTIVWLVASRQSSKRRVLRPRPVRRTTPKAVSKDEYQVPAPKPSSTRFCHECGQPVEPEDRFCRNCGTAVKK